MRTALLKRTERSDQGTFGTLTLDNMRSWVTGELPWRDLNKDGIGDPNISCITAGIYQCRWYRSARFGYERYHVEGVVGRTGILIHAGNWVGDTKKGYDADALGCILLGRSRREVENYLHRPQMKLFDSRKALLDLEAELRHQPFELTIVEAY